MKEEKKINTIQYQSDKEKTLRDTLECISKAKRFTIVAFNEEQHPPIRIITFCDDGEEERTITESALCIHQVISLLESTKQKRNE